MTDADATSPGYWARHLRARVRFGDGVRAVLAGPPCVLLEVGPGEALSTIARQHGTEARATYVASLPGRSQSGVRGEAVASALARLWASGAPVDWRAYHSGARRRRVVLPTYPFERARHWIDRAVPVDESLGQQDTGSNGSAETTSHPRPPIAAAHVAPGTELERVIAGIWEEMLGVDGVGVDDPFVDLGGHSLMATQITSRIRECFGVDVALDHFFELETISGLAVAVEEALVAEIESMSDEEVALLARPDDVPPDGT
jgi:acyl transferase domain-containing protein